MPFFFLFFSNYVLCYWKHGSDYIYDTFIFIFFGRGESKTLCSIFLLQKDDKVNYLRCIYRKLFIECLCTLGNGRDVDPEHPVLLRKN